MRCAFAILALSVLGSCSGTLRDTIDDAKDNSYDQALLAKFKAALPSKARLKADTPQDAANVAGDAALPQFAAGPAQAINGWSTMMVDVIDGIVANPPTMWSEEERKFLWGPGANDDAYGNVALYIQENDASEDMRYTYAFLRLPEDNNWDNAVAVIWGGATTDPDDQDKGVGVTLYDFDANHAFDEANDPAYDTNLPRTTGRFVALYGDQDGDDGNIKYNVAILRNLMPEEGTDTGVPINLNYFFGHFTGLDDNTLTFLDWEQLEEICDADQNCWEDFDPAVGSAGEGIEALEVLKIHMAFVNEGIGRAEGFVAQGDLDDSVFGYAECWNALIERTQFYVDPDLTDDQPGTALIEDGTCVEPFSLGLDELSIPSLDQLREDDPSLLPNMECVALHGLMGCEQCKEANGGDVEACK